MRDAGGVLPGCAILNRRFLYSVFYYSVSTVSMRVIK